MRIISFALLLISLLFLSCSDGNDSNSSDLVSCKFGKSTCPENSTEGCTVQNFPFSKNEGFCSEHSMDWLKENDMSIDDLKKDCYGGSGKESESTAEFSYEGCPGGSILKCPNDGYVLYYYSNDEEFIKNNECEAEGY